MTIPVHIYYITTKKYFSLSQKKRSSSEFFSKNFFFFSKRSLKAFSTIKVLDVPRLSLSVSSLSFKSSVIYTHSLAVRSVFPLFMLLFYQKRRRKPTGFNLWALSMMNKILRICSCDLVNNKQ